MAAHELNTIGRLGLAFERSVRHLTALGACWTVVGGLAVSARAEPRFTRDIDLAVSVGSDATAERLVRELLARGYRMLQTLEQVDTGRMATVRLGTLFDDQSFVVVDLLFASSGIEPEIVAAASRIEILPQIIAPVAQTGHLIATKALARDDDRRPQDLIDLRALLKIATSDDLRLARQAAALIEQRGYNRGRDIIGPLEEELRKAGRC